MLTCSLCFLCVSWQSSRGMLFIYFMVCIWNRTIKCVTQKRWKTHASLTALYKNVFLPFKMKGNIRAETGHCMRTWDYWRLPESHECAAAQPGGGVGNRALVVAECGSAKRNWWTHAVKASFTDSSPSLERPEHGQAGCCQRGHVRLGFEKEVQTGTGQESLSQRGRHVLCRITSSSTLCPCYGAPTGTGTLLMQNFRRIGGKITFIHFLKYPGVMLKAYIWDQILKCKTKKSLQ